MTSEDIKHQLIIIIIFKYAEWPSKWLTNESQMPDYGDLMKEKKKKKKKKILFVCFLIYLCRVVFPDSS